MPTFLFIRHGVNDYTGKRLIGRTPGVHLNAEGRKQAIAVAAYLRDLEFKAIFSSPMERAVETAAPLAELKGIQIEKADALNEVDFGRLSGKTNSQLRRLRIWEVVHTRPSDVQFPGGETLVHAQQRVVDFIEETSQRFEKPDLIACFAHSDVVRLMLAHYLCIQLNDFHRLTVDTASISTLQHHPDAIRILNMNQTVFPISKNSK